MSIGQFCFNYYRYLSENVSKIGWYAFNCTIIKFLPTTIPLCLTLLYLQVLPIWFLIHLKILKVNLFYPCQHYLKLCFLKIWVLQINLHPSHLLLSHLYLCHHYLNLILRRFLILCSLLLHYLCIQSKFQVLTRYPTILKMPIVWLLKFVKLKFWVLRKCTKLILLSWIHRTKF